MSDHNGGALSRSARNETDDYDMIHKEIERLHLNDLGGLPITTPTTEQSNLRTHVRSATWGGPSDQEIGEHVAFNLVNQLLDEDINADSGHEDAGSPVDLRQFDWSGQSWQGTPSESNFLYPGGSYGSLSSYSSADSALVPDVRLLVPQQSVWAGTNAGPALHDAMLSSEDKPSSSAPPSTSSSPPSGGDFYFRQQSSPLIQSDEYTQFQNQCLSGNSGTTNRHSYPQVSTSGFPQPKIKQPLLATPPIPNGKDVLRGYRGGNGGFPSKPVYPARYHNGRNFNNGHLRQYPGTYNQSSHQYHSKPPMQHYHGHQQYGQVQLRYSDRQNRPPRLANKSRRFSDGILYTSFDPLSQDQFADPMIGGLSMDGGPPLPPPPQQLHMGLRGTKPRKSSVVGRSHSFHYPPHGRPTHFFSPHSSTPGSSPPMPHEQRSYTSHQGYPSYSQRMYNKTYPPSQSAGGYPVGNGQALPYECGWPKPSQELHMQLESCLEETKHFQLERKKAEADLATLGYPPPARNSFHGLVPRLPPNPTRVDKLIVDQFREHAKMEAFISRLERLCHALLPPDVEMAMHHWLSAIKAVQATRQEEREAMADPARRGQWDEREVLAIAASVEDLIHVIQQSRSILWSFLHISEVPPLAPESQADIFDDQRQFTVSDEWDTES